MQQDPRENHPLFQIIHKKGDCLDTFKQWVEEHPEVNIKRLVYQAYGITYTLMDSAIQYDRKAIFEYLVTQFYGIKETMGWRYETILHIVSECKRYDWIRFLVERGAVINVQDQYGATPLIRVLNAKEADIALLNTVKELISHGADVNVKDDCGKTGLFYIAENYHDYKDEETLEIVKTIMDLLIEKGVDLSVRAAVTGRTVAEDTWYSGKALEYFLLHKAPLGVSDERLETIFTSHVSRGNFEITKLLLERFPMLKRTITTPDGDGKTALDCLRLSPYRSNLNQIEFKKTYDVLTHVAQTI